MKWFLILALLNLLCGAEMKMMSFPLKVLNETELVIPLKIGLTQLNLVLHSAISETVLFNFSRSKNFTIRKKLN
jgi:hypothetical protein